jgi:hypothetical protein
MKATFAVLLVCVLTTALPVWAQVDTATVTGTVRDSSGAVLPNVTVTATEMDTGIRTAAKTASDGHYVITPLKIGKYSVSADATGFQRETRQNIVLDVQQNQRLDFQLHVGSVSQTAEVISEAPLLETETASLGQVVTAQQVEELPLNGRRYTDLAELTAGVAKVTEGPVNGGNSPTNGNAGGSFAVNGTRGDQNDFILDGIDNVSNDNADVAILSSVDAIAEFKIQTSNYSPEFGRGGGAVINASTKSGTNNLHGEVWEFLRNQAFDARGFFEQPTDRKAPYKQNQFGAALGGPIKRDKAFFFVDYEGTRIHSAQTDFASVPLAGESTGNFSSILGQVASGTDALGRPVFPNEIYDPSTTRTVTAGQLDTGCSGLTATSSGTVRDGFGFNCATGLPGPQANIIPSGSMNSVGLAYAALYPAPNLSGTANNYTVNAPGYDQIDQTDVRADENLTSKIQLFQRFSLIEDSRFQAPVFPGLADGGHYNTGNRPLESYGAVTGLTYTVSPNLVNSLRFGFNWVHYVSNVPSYGQHYPPANLQIPGVPNNPLINGLTWLAPSGYRGLGEPLFTPTRSTSQDIQLNDTLSWVHGKHLIKAGPQFRFDQFNLLQIGQPRGNLSFSGQFTSDSGSGGDGSGNGLADMLVGIPVSSTISTVTYFGNRQRTYGAFVEDNYKATSKLTFDLGLRYDYATPLYEVHNRESNFDYAKGILVPDGTPGYPKHLADPHKDNFAPRVGLAYSPFQSKPLVIRAGFGRFFAFYEIRTGDPLQIDYNLPFFFEPTFDSDGITPSPVTLATGFTGLIDPNNATFAGVTSQDFHPKTPVYDQWNVDLEYQLPGQILISPAYVGTKGSHLQVLRDLNQIPTPQASFDPIQAPFCDPIGPPANGVCRFSTFTSITNSGNSTYHAFQLKAEKRTSHGLYLLSAFTYGKAINDQPEICCNSPWPQDSFNIRAEKGLADFDNRERWVTSVDYELPVGKGRQFLNQGGVLDAIVGGWHLGGIITFRSGFPFSPQIDFDPSNTGSPGLQRSNQIGNGHLAHPTPNLWFNVNDFPQPNCPNGCFGNAGKNILEGPGEKTADLSLRKFFNFTEQTNLEFRAEFFNAFNHAVFQQPDPFITDGAGAAGVITDTVIPQRQVQFALKLHF